MVVHDHSLSNWEVKTGEPELIQALAVLLAFMPQIRKITQCTTHVWAPPSSLPPGETLA